VNRNVTGTVHVDRAVAKRILAGDEQAFRELFNSFFPRLYRFAAARLDGDEEAASDVVQQTFCKALEGLDSYRGEAALYTWFCQICRNVLVDHCRSTNRRNHSEVLFEDHTSIRAVLEAMTGPVTDRPETAAWQSDVQRFVQATIDILPAHYGDILEWKYVEGLAVKQIAAKLNVSAKAAESTLTRAREAFRETIAEMIDQPDALRPPNTPNTGPS
jgi:RNA polymerase sigma-70 factor (ECF subfamily)